MSWNQQLRRLVAAGAVVAAPLLTIPGASATPADPAGSHQITICHVTNSAHNPYVVITIDVAAFDGQGRSDHAHHISKVGRVDLPYVGGQCGQPPSTSPPTVGT